MMQISLQLDTDRYSPADRGFFLDLIGDEAWAQRQNAERVYLEPSSRYLILAPIQTYDSRPLSEFTPSDSENWEEIAQYWPFAGLALHHRKRVVSAIAKTAALEINQASIIGIHTAEPIDQAPIYLRWGLTGSPAVQQITVKLAPGARPYVEIADISATPPYPVMTFEMSDGPILEAARLYGQAFTVLCIPLRQRLLLWSELWGAWFITPAWSEGKPHWVDGSVTHYYCLRAGKFSVECDAIFDLSFRALSYETAGEFEIPFALDYTPTVMPEAEIDWEMFSGCGASVVVKRTNGTAYQLGDTEGKVIVNLIGNGPHTPIINKILVKWAPTAEFLAGNPVAPDLISLRENLSADPGQDSIDCTIRPGAGETGLWKRPNLPFTVTVDGDTVRMRGLADTPTLTEPAAENATYEMTLRSGWKRLEHALIGQVQAHAYDGMTFTAAIIDLLHIAGVDDTEIHVEADTTPLPSAEDGKEPLYKFAPGMTVAQAIEQLRDEWNADWVMYHAHDGFHIQAPPGSTPAYTFIRATDAGADPDHVARELEIWSDDTYFCNWLLVWGRDDDGNVIHSDLLQDADSINNPAAADYVGELRAVIILNTSANTIAKCNLIAAKFWPVWNSIPRFCRWRGPFVKTLYPHMAVLIENVEGNPADDLTVRILEMRTEFLPNLGLTSYYGEVLPA
jgi:hypothetical protein